MPIVRLPGGSLRDEIREPVFDTLDIVNGDTINTTRQFYSAVQGKDKTLTNLRQNNLLETAVSFRVQGLALDVQNSIAANAGAIPLVMENSAIDLIVGEKTYWTGPMRFTAGRLWTDLAATGAAATHEQHGIGSVATIVLVGKHVIDINPLQSFRVEWLTSNLNATELAIVDPAANSKLRYVCSLKGLKRRPVQ